MIPLSAGTAPPSFDPSSFDDDLRRPLTLDELEALHGVEPGAAASSDVPWNLLTLVVVACGLTGFLLPLIAAQILF